MNNVEYRAEELDPLILFADNHLLAVNKPAGMLTQDSGTGLRNMEDWAREWVRVDKNKEGNVFLNAVHRIDKAVSGVVLFARTSKALSRLNEDIRNRDCKKTYHVLVEGAPEDPSAKLIHWLMHEQHRAVVCEEGTRGAQRAVLRYRTLKQLGNLTLLPRDRTLSSDPRTARCHRMPDCGRRKIWVQDRIQGKEDCVASYPAGNQASHQPHLFHHNGALSGPFGVVGATVVPRYPSSVNGCKAAFSV
jgi:23S rRNA-/tRNA-specific pseudouridylate synthase